MLLDTTSETLIPLAQVIRDRLIPPARNGRQLHFSTLMRWILKGATGPDGKRVRLEAVRIGGRYLTSREAIQRFAEACTPKHDDCAEPAPTQTPARRRRAAERAGELLREAGV